MDPGTKELRGVATDRASLFEKFDATSFATDLACHGFDLCDAFYPRWYNEWVQAEKNGLKEIEEENVAAAFLIGNTKALWPKFKAWYRSLPSDEKPEHPIDTYCRTTVSEVVKRHSQNNKQTYHLYWSDTYGTAELVSMPQVASVSAAAYIEPQTHLAVHPKYGTWISYRAVAVFFREDDTSTQKLCPRPPALLASPLSQEEQIAAKNALERALELSNLDDLRNRLLESYQVAEAWIAMRDAVELGKEYRFDTDQLFYHYTKDPKYLED